MKYTLKLIFCFFIFSNTKAQNIENLLENFTNMDAVAYSESFKIQNDDKAERYSITRTLHNRIKLKNVDTNWSVSIKTLIEDDPKLLEPFLNSTTHDFAAFILILDFFDIELNSENEQIVINSIYGHVLNDEALDILAPNSTEEEKELVSNETFYFYWNEIRDESITRIKSIVGIN